MSANLKNALAVILSTLAPRVILGCGFTIHMSVTHRAINNYFSGPPMSFETLFVENRGALEGGSPYPDYGYQCGPNHDDGEYTHWAPYQFQAANWILKNYQQPFNSSGQTIVTFLAGAVSHYIADISWHGLAETPQDYGLIESIGFLDFNCTGLCTPAHSQADTGGEFIAAFATAITWDDPNTWTIPVNDLVSILNYVNRTVAKGHMVSYVTLFKTINVFYKANPYISFNLFFIH